MKKFWFRSIIFNIFFYGLSALSAILAIPTLFMPRGAIMFLTRIYQEIAYWLEKYILGLSYEVRGIEHLPKDGKYIVAAKHQSAYETMKLHILFGDPAIILKKELLSLPIWGKCLEKTDVIAIDRSTPDSAIQSIQDGAKRMAAANRPIVIFPQGTRVGLDTPVTRRPYKIGVVRIQEATDLPIIPLAMNSGYFWPRNSFFKRPGKVIFEFLPAIAPGKAPDEILEKLSKTVEEKSNELLTEARSTKLQKNWFMRIIVCLAVLYSGLWFGAAHYLKSQYSKTIDNLDYVTRTSAPIKTSGFPGQIQFSIAHEEIQTFSGLYSVHDIFIKAWPIPFLPAFISTGEIKVSTQSSSEALTLDRLEAHITPKTKAANIQNGILHAQNTQIIFDGEIAYGGAPYPDTALRVTFDNPAPFISALSDAGMINTHHAQTVLGVAQGFQTNSEDKLNTIPIRVNDNELYVGPFKVSNLLAR